MVFYYFRRYKKKFMTFLNDVIMKKNDNCMTQWKNLVLEVWGTLSDESVETLDGSVSSENVNDNFENLFVVDTTPTIKDDLDIPTYGKVCILFVNHKKNKQTNL